MWMCSLIKRSEDIKKSIKKVLKAFKRRKGQMMCERERDKNASSSMICFSLSFTILRCSFNMQLSSIFMINYFIH